MRRVIGMDIHRTFGEVVFWEDGKLRHGGRVDMTRTALEGFGKSLLATDEVVIEATGNCMAVARVLSPFVKRVVIANPLQVKAIAHAHVKTDKIDAGTLASLCAAGYLPEIWTPDAATERMRRLVARRYQVVRHRTRIKNEVHAILHAHLISKCPHADLFNGPGRAWLMRQPVPDDERAAIERHVRELDRLAEDLAILDREIAESTMDDPAIRRLLTITGVNLTVAAGLGLIGPKLRFWPSLGTFDEHQGLLQVCSRMATFAAVNLKPRRFRALASRKLQSARLGGPTNAGHAAAAGRDFLLAAGQSGAGPFRQLLVVYRDDIFLKIPISATDLYPPAPDAPTSKLSTASVRDFIRLASIAKVQARQSSVDRTEHDSLTSETESPLSKSHGSLEGEP
ncbi:transposase [Mesorhizobium newzealandense]|uniref:Transposase n=1 Tax=Mesorhizobium newzealandense TaxID=1300302 RepID=A0ABW4UHJ9_9HYPH